jgi:uncharacterized membrane-anchored protein YhcB (DUF1043 family)
LSIIQNDSPSIKSNFNYLAATKTHLAMPTAPEFTILYGLLACIVLYLIFKYIAKNSIRQKKQILLERIKSLRLDSIKLQEEVSTYMLAHNAEHEATQSGLTIGQFYRQLKHNHAAHLSSKLIEKLQNSDNPLLINKASEELDDQEAKLKEAQSLFSVTTKSKKQLY